MTDDPPDEDRREVAPPEDFATILARIAVALEAIQRELHELNRKVKK